MLTNRKGVIILSISNGLVSGGYGLSIPFFAIYLTVTQHLSASLVGALLGLSMLATTAASALSGEMTDAFGRKKIMVWSLILRAFFVFMMALSMVLQTNFLWTVVAHFFASFFGAFFRPASNAWVADNVDSRHRVEAYGILRIGLNIGWAAGPALGGFLAAASYPLAFALTGVFYIAGALSVYFQIQDAKKLKEEFRKTQFADLLLELKNKRFAVFCFLVFMMSVVLAQLTTGLSLFSVKYLGLGNHEIGILFAINGAMVVVFQYFAGKFMNSVRITSAMAMGCVCYAVGYNFIGFAGGFWLAALGVAFATVGEMALSPGTTTLASNIAPHAQRGRYLGMTETARQFGSCLGMFAGGYFIEHISPFFTAGPWVIFAAAAIFCAWGFAKMSGALSAQENGVHSAMPAEITAEPDI